MKRYLMPCVLIACAALALRAEPYKAEWESLDKRPIRSGGWSTSSASLSIGALLVPAAPLTGQCLR